MNEQATAREFRVVVGVDYSRAAKLALDEALGIVSQRGGRVLAVRVLPDRRSADESFLRQHRAERDQLERYCNARCASLMLDHLGPAHFRIDAFIRYGRADEQLRSFAERVLAQMIIVGPSHDRSRWQRAIRPPVADALVRGAPCPVLVARRVKSGTFYVGELLGVAPPGSKRSA